MEALLIIVVGTGAAICWGCYQGGYSRGWDKGFHDADAIADRVWRKEFPELYAELKKRKSAMFDAEPAP